MANVDISVSQSRIPNVFFQLSVFLGTLPTLLACTGKSVSFFGGYSLEDHSQRIEFLAQELGIDPLHFSLPLSPDAASVEERIMAQIKWLNQAFEMAKKSGLVGPCQDCRDRNFGCHFKSREASLCEKLSCLSLIGIVECRGDGFSRLSPQVFCHPRGGKPCQN